MADSAEVAWTPQPHFVPGYTGHCPQYLYRCGHTYGRVTHNLLVDPTIHHADTLILADRTADEYQVYRPALRDVDVLKARERHGDPVYRYPMTPGYEGFVPRLAGQLGQTFSTGATSALSQFELQQYKDRRALKHLRKLGALQDDKWDSKTLQDKTLVRSDYKMPLEVVRPEQSALVRHRTVVEPALVPPTQSKTPYFMDNHPDKYIVQGATVSVPFGYAKFGASNEPMTNSALCDFTSNYRRRLATEWAPVNLVRSDPPLRFQPMEIYTKHTGLLPNYTGHCPGARFSLHNQRIFWGNINQATQLVMVDTSYVRQKATQFRFHGHTCFGCTDTHQKNLGVSRCDFTSNHRQRRCNAWTPTHTGPPDAPLHLKCAPIHLTGIPLIPNYSGHVPGYKFRYGRTFGSDTVNAKLWLRCK